jgi:hypothetical protein
MSEIVELIAKRWAELEREADTDTHDEGLDGFNIGMRDGFSDAVQLLDVLTGGDGEYRFCTNLDPDRHCPTPVEMAERIVARIQRNPGGRG